MYVRHLNNYINRKYKIMLFPELQSLEEFEFISNLGSGYSSM